VEILPFTIIIWFGSVLAGLVGSLTGLGGGVIIIPLLTLGLGVDIRYAIGASLVAVIATSSGAATAYIKEGYANIRIGMFLEIATVFGALIGAFLATILHTSAIAVIFGAVLILSAYQSAVPQKKIAQSDGKPDPIASYLKMDSSYPTANGMKPYHVRAVPTGFGLMFGAGTISGLLGVGAGVVKVLAMDRAMKIPFKVSTTTSNFMIGVTAAASAGIYLSRGYIDPAIVMPVVLGVLSGAVLGARKLPAAKTRHLKIIFAIAVFIIAIEMIYKGLAGKI
jgi:hypothetical protein